MPEQAAPDLPTTKKRTVNTAKAIERNDLAALIKDLGGIDPKGIGNYAGAPEQRQTLGRLILKKGGLPVDIMIGEAKAHYPEQFAGFETPDDLVRYFLDGRHTRALKQGSIEKQIEAYNADIEDEAKRRGVTPEELIGLEADVEREIAAERAAIQSEGGADLDLEAGWPTAARQEAFLTPTRKPLKLPKLTARLDALQADYPDIDRDRAATVIRALPNAEDHQVAAMSADPAMFNQVAKGNLKASEKAQLLKKATDAGAQQGLPGMGVGGGLFGPKYSISPAPVFYSQMAKHLEVKTSREGQWF